MAEQPNDPDLKYSDLEALKTGGDFQEKNIELKRWLFDRRLDYAWNFFDFRAKQRMSMFNYFLIFVGFVISAYAALLKDGNLLVSSILAATAAVLTCVFVRLERRNEELVFIAEDVLMSLECDVLFARYDRDIPWPHRRFLGRMNTNRALKPLGIFRRQKEEDAEFEPSRNEHGKWLPRFQIVIILIFVTLAILPWLPMNITVGHHTIPVGIGTHK